MAKTSKKASAPKAATAKAASKAAPKRKTARRKPAEERPVTVVIAAMGGEGGGVLTAWLVDAARKSGLPVQATSIPGVAQRTGATTYYVEIVPKPYAETGDIEPVLDLYPGPGDIDMMIATELMEVGRAMEKGFISPEKTTLIGSTHRVYTLAEKMAMGDGRYDGDKILDAAKQMSKRHILFDIERAAQDAGTIVNSVLLGAMAGSGVLPIEPETFKDGIRESGKAVESNLAGFDVGFAYATGDVVELQTKLAPPKAPAPRPGDAAGELKGRIERDYPSETHAVVLEACGRCLDYQDAAYARLYLNRLDTVKALDESRGDGDFKITNEAARHLGLRMTFEDIMRVAQLKTRRSRFERMRRDVQAQDDQLVRTTEHFKPGPYEFASVLPKGLGRRVVDWADRNPARARKWHFGLHIRTDTVWGFARVRTLAGMRRFRRRGYRYAEEQDLIEGWLDLVRKAAAVGKPMALETIECARLIKGYSETHKRGVGNYRRIVAEIVEPALAEGVDRAGDIAQARAAALADPEGESLSEAIAAMAEAREGAAVAAE
ncbi:MAG: indolepyruvate oxidoreductase subunit beta family protein [Rhodospirillaceae bacterium]|nr:indolepyruvate oxidoreductase subunit beta family protein [Rhodospirillaceae bacterium]